MPPAGCSEQPSCHPAHLLGLPTPTPPPRASFFHFFFPDPPYNRKQGVFLYRYHQKGGPRGCRRGQKFSAASRAFSSGSGFPGKAPEPGGHGATPPAGNKAGSASRGSEQRG